MVIPCSSFENDASCVIQKQNKNPLEPTLDGRQFAKYISKCISLYGPLYGLLVWFLEFVSKVAVNNLQ